VEFNSHSVIITLWGMNLLLRQPKIIGISSRLWVEPVLQPKSSFLAQLSVYSVNGAQAFKLTVTKVLTLRKAMHLEA
jgi:hypothetical protein